MKSIAARAKDSSRLTRGSILELIREARDEGFSTQTETAETARAVVFLHQQSYPAQRKTQQQQDHEKYPARGRDFLFLDWRRGRLTVGTLESNVLARRWRSQRRGWLVSRKLRGHVGRRAHFGFGFGFGRTFMQFTAGAP